MASEVKANKLSPSSGTALQIGDASDTVTIPTGATFTVTDGIGVASGGTGLASFTAGDILYATGSTTLAKLAKGTAEQILSMNSGATAPEWTTAAATAGGTGQTSFTAGDILYANSTTTLTKLGKGTGLQGLQTNSGATAPQWADSPQSVMTAAGDILYASGANTLAKLAKGAATEVIAMNSGATAPEWVTAGGGGLLQIKQAVKTDHSITTVTSYTDISGLTIDISPTLATSKILVFLNVILGSQNNAFAAISLVRDSTQIYMGTDGSRTLGIYGTESSGGGRVVNSATAVYIDAPATTSATTYKAQVINESGGTGTINRTYDTSDDATLGTYASSITAMELAVGVL